MNETDLKNILARNPQLTVSDNLGHNHTVSEGVGNTRQVPASKSELGKKNEVVGVEERKVESMGCPRVSFVFYRCRLLDVDGFRGGEKDLLDGLVKACLLPGDKVGEITLDPPRQVKVDHRNQEETVITIRYE